MAKGGRKITTSRSELYLGSALGYGQVQGTEPDFGEDEVWSVVDDERAPGIGAWEPRSFTQDSGEHRRTAEHRRRYQAGGLSVAFDDDHPGSVSPQRIVHQFRPEPQRVRQVAASAPMDVPDWSKMYSRGVEEWDDGSDEEEEVVPPHEYLARSRKMAANSVFEGVGRTLKGRDLSRVRDAVWSQTGFDG